MYEMTYYWSGSIKDEVVARSYKTQTGFVFDIGSRFEQKDPVTGLNGFFAIRHMVRETQKDLNREICRLKKKYPNLHITKEEYR